MIMSNIDCQNTYLYLFVDIGFVSFNTLFKFILFFPIFNKAIPNLYQFFYIIIPINFIIALYLLYIFLYIFVAIVLVSFNSLFNFILFFPIFNKAIPNLYQFFYIIIPIILVKHFYFIGIFKINEDPILILLSTSKTPSI